MSVEALRLRSLNFYMVLEVSGQSKISGNGFSILFKMSEI